MRRVGHQHGAVAVEFALILPLLLLIVVGVLEFGRVWSQVQVFQGAAREGARCAAVQAGEQSAGLPVCDIQASIDSASGAYTPDTDATVVVEGGNGTPFACSDRIGQDVTVSWAQPLEISIPFWRDVTVTTNIEGVFRCE